MLSILKQFNWLDIFVIILLFRTLYVSAKNGFVIELFKFLGIVTATYLSLHYYAVFSAAIRQRVFAGKAGPGSLNFAVFLVLVIAGFLGFALLRNIFTRLIKIEAVSTLNHWGGFVLGAARAVLLSGLIVFTLAVSGNGYLRNSAKNSYCGRRLIGAAPAAYSRMWDSLMSKFCGAEKFNQDVISVKEEFLKQ